MKKSKLDNPHIKKEVIKRLAVGESQASIAESVNLDQSQISRFKSREDIKPFIEKEQLRLLEAVPDAVENIKELVREMKNIPKKETRRHELSYKASQDILKSVGIMPTPMQAQVIANIFNAPLMTPFVQVLIEEHAKKMSFSEEELKLYGISRDGEESEKE